MAVAKIHAERPNILLVEKSVSRFAQEYLLAKDISLVLNIKRPLLERIARCTGAQIIPSVDHLSSQKLGNCENFRVDRFLEEHGSTGQVGKKVVKTLMYFENCPKPLGFTILLMGANEDELKKVKHVVQYGVFAAYHLALETSFLADEGASPELPLNSPITVALPDKSMSIERSISTVPGFTVSTYEKSPTMLSCAEPQRANSVPVSELLSTTANLSIQKDIDPMIPNGSGWQTRETNPSFVFSQVNLNPDGDSTGDTGFLHSVQKEADTNPDLNQEKDDGGEVSPSKTLPDTSYPLENKLDVRRTQSDGQIVMKNLSATLDAAWIGERQTSVEIPVNNKVLLPPSSMSNYTTFPPISEGLKPIDLPEQQNEFKVAYPVSPAML
ncbi:PREDICTED: 1-phosphatidylinositol-3-phosphate 5-kinase FAB1B-like, partial [Camelina sativa]|uniref:1-phosphatidylinositol-3-phosphate 5-kinase FAB1B-like n=1 Tax=Camelina sativa TaxID=90675 RepID=A0ABM0Y8D3_CAMSA